jgi:hypothetical protein
MRRVLLFALSIVLLVGGAVGAPAEERAAIGDDFLISGPGAVADEAEPAVAFDPTRYQYLVVWTDKRLYDVGEIYGRLLAADGTPLTGDFRVSRVSEWGAQFSPAVAFNPDANEYLVVWVDSRNYGTLLRGWDIYGRRVSAEGDPQGKDILISGPNADHEDNSPAVAYSPAAGTYLVVWADKRGYPVSDTDIYGRRVGGDGKPIGNDRRISGRSALGDEWFPSVAYNTADQEFLVVWTDYRAPEGRAYGRRVAPDLTFPAREFRISSRAAEVSYFADVAYDPDLNQYLVAWKDRRNFAVSQTDTYAVRLNAAGVRQGRDRPLSTAVGFEDQPSVTYQTVNDRFFIVWKAHPDDFNAFVMGRALTGGGLFAGPVFQVTAGELGLEQNPDVAYGAGAGRCLVVWDDGRELATRGIDIYGHLAKG